MYIIGKKTINTDNCSFQLINTTDAIIDNNNLEYIKMPKSPRCLAIMNVRKRHDRLSTLVTLENNKTCQTQLSNTDIIRTNNPTTIESPIQVDTIKDRFDDLYQVRIEKDTAIDGTNEERILQALTDRDGKLIQYTFHIKSFTYILIGQRWSELIDQLINEQSQFSPSDNAQQLLDTVWKF